MKAVVEHNERHRSTEDDRSFVETCLVNLKNWSFSLKSLRVCCYLDLYFKLQWKSVQHLGVKPVFRSKKQIKDFVRKKEPTCQARFSFARGVYFIFRSNLRGFFYTVLWERNNEIIKIVLLSTMKEPFYTNNHFRLRDRSLFIAWRVAEDFRLKTVTFSWSHL